MHDAVAGRNHVDIGEGAPGPFDEMEPVFVAPVLDLAVLGERVGVVAAMLDGQAVIDDQLRGDDGIDLGGIAALVGDGVAQAREVDQRGLAENVVAHDARRIPGEVEIVPAVGDLDQRVRQTGGIAATDQLLGEHAQHIGQAIVRARPDFLDGGAGIVEVEHSAGQADTICLVHGVALSLIARAITAKLIDISLSSAIATVLRNRAEPCKCGFANTLRTVHKCSIRGPGRFSRANACAA